MARLGMLALDKELWQKEFYYLVLLPSLTRAPLYLRVFKFHHSELIAASSCAGRRMPKETGPGIQAAECHRNS